MLIMHILNLEFSNFQIFKFSNFQIVITCYQKITQLKQYSRTDVGIPTCIANAYFNQIEANQLTAAFYNRFSADNISDLLQIHHEQEFRIWDKFWIQAVNIKT